MQWMSDKAPNGNLVFDNMKNKVNTLDALSTIFHEEVEFAECLKMVHSLNIMINIEYFQKHYREAYPTAHRKATIKKINQVKYFAKKKGITNIPELTFNLVSPLLELHTVSAERLNNKMKFNVEYQAHLPLVTENDLETAMKIYEAGGYKYEKRNKNKV
jgi:hypothetical protein